MTIPRKINEFNLKTLSEDATACKQSASRRASQFTQTGKRFLLLYLISLPASTLLMVNDLSLAGKVHRVAKYILNPRGAAEDAHANKHI